ncbi:MAG: transcription termination/antitermination protein NusG [Bacilli bacterium]|jgi:transcriptional antiterminator NusG|nr:transcription termination/antitermination protein NusG [Bacilli bacterium]
MELDEIKTSEEAELNEETKPAHTYNPLIGQVNPDEDDDSDGELPEKAWYVINTFAMRERQVKEALEKRAESFNMTDKIFRVICAEYEEPVLDENGKQKMSVDKKTGQKVPKIKVKNYYPGYIFVEMIMTDETWFVVRNTPGVSGITGSSGKGAKPFPIPREEIEPVLKRMHIEDPDIYSEYKVGDQVKILTGTFQDNEGTIESIDTERGEVTIQITLFGRYSTIPAKFSDIEKVQDTPSFEY